MILFRFSKSLHCKKCYDFVSNDQNNVHPYAVIFALQDFDLRVYDGSHLKIAAHRYVKPTEHDRFSLEHKGTFHTVRVNQGCFIVFDGGLVHSGAPYDSDSGDSYRIHFYVLPDGYEAMVTPYRTSKSVTYCDVNTCEVCKKITDDILLKNIMHNGKLLIYLSQGYGTNN